MQYEEERYYNILLNQIPQTIAEFFNERLGNESPKCEKHNKQKKTQPYFFKFNHIPENLRIHVSYLSCLSKGIDFHPQTTTHEIT